MKVYLIRHAQSEYNIGEDLIEKEIGKDYLNSEKYLLHKYNPQLMDCGITQLGVQQCVQAAQKMHQVHIDVVIVSPFRRALLTCNQIFKNHPSKPKIYVNPLFRQFYDSSCDIGSRLNESMQSLPHYDFSLIKVPETWYVDCPWFHPQAKQIVQQKLKDTKKEQLQQTCALTVLELMKNFRNQGKILDPHESLVNRNKHQVEFLKLFSGKSVAVVSHSQNIKYYVGTKIANCEIREYHIQEINF